MLPLLAVQVNAASELEENQLFKAVYKGKLSGFKVTLTRTLTHNDDNAYTLDSIARNGFASISEKSTFLNVENYFVPTGYDYKRSILGNKSKQKITFDWANHKAYYRREDKPSRNTDHDIAVGILDPSLYQLKLQQDLFEQKESLTYDYIKLTRIDSMNFVFNKESTFELNGKQLKATQYKRLREDSKKQTFVTLIPSLAYQIAKITHVNEDGKAYTLELKDFNYDKERLEAFYKH